MRSPIEMLVSAAATPLAGAGVEIKPLTRLLGELTEDLFGFDFKIVRTLRLLLIAPGPASGHRQ